MPLSALYLWLKALHIAFMVTWFAGLFYLPRLFIYHSEAADDTARSRFTVMERRLFIIMTIGAVLTALFGFALLYYNQALLAQGWFQVDRCETPEFDRWRWVEFWRPVNEVIYFKRRVYARALYELGPHLYAENLNIADLQTNFLM